MPNVANYTRQERAVMARGATDDEAIDAVALQAKRAMRGTPLGRAHRSAASAAGGPVDGVLVSVFTNLVSIAITGRPTTEEGFSEMLTTTGIAAVDRALSALEPDSGQTSPLHLRTEYLSLPHLRAAAIELPWHELVSARDIVSDLAPLLPIVAELLVAVDSIPDVVREWIRSLNDLTLAMLIPAVASLAHVDHDGFETIATALRQQCWRPTDPTAPMARNRD